MPNDGRRPIQVGLVVLFTCLAIALCSYDLGTRSIWEDEGASLSIASQHGTALFSGIARDGGNFAVYYLLLHLVISLFGVGTLVLRMPSLVAAAVVVPLTYLLGRRLAGATVGLYAAALVSLSEPLVYWGQNARGYTLAAAFAAASSFFFLGAARTGRRRELICWWLCSALLCYTMLLAALVVAAQVLSLLAAEDGRVAVRRLRVALALVVVVCLPLPWLALRRGSGQLFWLARPSIATVHSVSAFLASAVYKNTEGTTENVLIAIFVGALIAAALLVVIDLVRHERDGAFAMVFAFAGVVVMPVLAYFESRVGTAVFADRYFAPCLPAAALLLALVAARLRPAPLGTLAVVGLLVLRATQLPLTYGVPLDDWRSVTAYVLSSARPGDCIAFYANDGFVDFSYYVEHPPADFPKHYALPRAVLPDDPVTSHPLLDEDYGTLSQAAISSVARSCPRLFLVANNAGHWTGPPASHLVRVNFLSMEGAIKAAYGERSLGHFAGVTTYLFFH